MNKSLRTLPYQFLFKQRIPSCHLPNKIAIIREAGSLRILVALCLSIVYLCCFCGCGLVDSGPMSDLIPEGTKPCERPEYWPFNMASTKHPFLVHYRSSSDIETVKKVIEYLDAAWDFEVNVLGFSPPLSDGGCCGPDGSFDIFIWRGKRTCFVDVISERIVTSWGGRMSYMILDPWGPYGGEILGQTIGHEFNHAAHAVDDWHESGDAFEMTATYVEQYFGNACKDCIADFQARPDWSLLWYDDYSTWYMYGSALYLYFLKDFYFPADEGFVGRLWHGVRNIPDPYTNKPNFVDGLNALLAPLGSSFVDSTIIFARWRYYTGNRDDGKHFKVWPLQWKQLPFIPEADLKLNGSIVFADTTYTVDTSPPMVLGSTYLEIVRDHPGRNSFQFSLLTPANPNLRWVVQAVPGIIAGTDGETIDLSAGSARISFSSEGKRTLIITLLPANAFDPDYQSGQTFPFSIRIAP